jgi:hypothetical protein
MQYAVILQVPFLCAEAAQYSSNRYSVNCVVRFLRKVNERVHFGWVWGDGGMGYLEIEVQ